MSKAIPSLDLRKLLPLLILALLSLWYANREASEQASPVSLGFEKDIDYYLKGVSTDSFDANGKLRYKLQAELATHRRSNDSVALTLPQMHYYIGPAEDPASDYWSIQSQNGHFYQEKPPRLARLELAQDVIIERINNTGERITTRTDEMWFLPATGELHSQSPVTISQGQHNIAAERLSINTHSNHIKLHGGVSGTYHPTPVQPPQNTP